MSKEEKRSNLYYSIFMVIVFCLFFAILPQILAGYGIDWTKVILGFPIMGLVAFLLCYFVPIAQWGFKLSVRLGIKPGSIGTGAVIMLLFVIVMVAVLSPLGAYVSMCVFGDLPAAVALSVCYNDWYLYVPIGFVLGMLVDRPLRALSNKLSSR